MIICKIDKDLVPLVDLHPLVLENYTKGWEGCPYSNFLCLNLMIGVFCICPVIINFQRIHFWTERNKNMYSSLMKPFQMTWMSITCDLEWMIF